MPIATVRRRGVVRLPSGKWSTVRDLDRVRCLYKRGLGLHSEKHGSLPSQYVITHANTGFSLAKFRDRGIALCCFNALAQIEHPTEPGWSWNTQVTNEVPDAITQVALNTVAVYEDLDYALEFPHGESEELTA